VTYWYFLRTGFKKQEKGDFKEEEEESRRKRA
jgi:hypothetical protein